MTVRLSPAEFAALGIPATKRAEARALGISAPQGKGRTTRKAVTGQSYWSRCVACGEVFTVRAAEDRHVTATLHARYEIAAGTQPGTESSRYAGSSPAPSPAPSKGTDDG